MGIAQEGLLCTVVSEVKVSGVIKVIVGEKVVCLAVCVAYVV